MSLAKQSFLYGFSSVVSAGFGVISSIIAVNYLAPSEFGITTSVASAVQWILIFVTFGNPAPMTRYFAMSGNEHERSGYVSGWLFTMSFISTIVFSVGTIMSHPISVLLFGKDEYYFVISLTVLSSVLALVLGVCLQVIRFQQRVWLFCSLQVVQSFFSLVFVCVAVLLDMGLKGMLQAHIAVSGILLPVSLFYIRDHLTIRIKRSYIREMVEFGVPLVPMTITWVGLSAVDRMMLVRHDVESAAIYAVAARLTIFPQFINSAFGMAWSPRAFEVYKKHHQEAGNYFGYILSIYLLLSSIVAAFMACVSREIIVFFAPNIYAMASVVTGLLMICIICDGSTYITQISFSIFNKTHLLVYPPFVAFFLNVVLNYFLIPQSSYIGAAIASVVSYFVLALTYFVMGQRLLRLHLPYSLPSVLLIFVLIIGVSAYFSGIENTFSYRVSILLFYVMISFYFGNRYIKYIKGF